MGTVPHSGEVWFVDLGMVGKPRYALVLAAQSDADQRVVLAFTGVEEYPIAIFVKMRPRTLFGYERHFPAVCRHDVYSLIAAIEVAAEVIAADAVKNDLLSVG